MLDVKEWRLITFVEQHYLLGNLQTYDQCATYMGVSTPEIIKMLGSESVRKALIQRGIKQYADASQGLSAEQLACANVMLDFSDRRAARTKLAELNVKPATYQGWLKQPEFQAYVRTRAEALLDDNMHEAHTALLGNVQRGDLSSIKLFYELQGRWSSKSLGDLNVDYILTRILESIQKHVKDPEAILAIAADVQELTSVPTTPPVAAFGQLEARQVDYDL